MSIVSSEPTGIEYMRKCCHVDVCFFRSDAIMFIEQKDGKCETVKVKCGIAVLALTCQDSVGLQIYNSRSGNAPADIWMVIQYRIHNF